MSWKFGYFVFGLLGLASMLFGLYCAARISSWGVGMVLALYFIRPLEHMQEFCWQEYKRQHAAVGGIKEEK